MHYALILQHIHCFVEFPLNDVCQPSRTRQLNIQLLLLCAYDPARLHGFISLIYCIRSFNAEQPQLVKHLLRCITRLVQGRFLQRQLVRKLVILVPCML